MFSYGSGVTSTLFTIKINENLDYIKEKMKIDEKFEKRIKISPEEFDKIMHKKETLYNMLPPYTPSVK